MENEEKVFADGFVVKQPHENTPDFVKANLAVNKAKAIEFIEKHADDRGWVNMDIKESKSGSWYIELNTWKPEKKEGGEEIKPSDIPF